MNTNIPHGDIVAKLKEIMDSSGIVDLNHRPAVRIRLEGRRYFYSSVGEMPGTNALNLMFKVTSRDAKKVGDLIASTTKLLTPLGGYEGLCVGFHVEPGLLDIVLPDREQLSNPGPDGKGNEAWELVLEDTYEQWFLSEGRKASVSFTGASFLLGPEKIRMEGGLSSVLKEMEEMVSNDMEGIQERLGRKVGLIGVRVRKGKLEVGLYPKDNSKTFYLFSFNLNYC